MKTIEFGELRNLDTTDFWGKMACTVISPPIRVAQKSLRFVWREGSRRSLYPEPVQYQEKIVKARVARGLEGEQENAPHGWGGEIPVWCPRDKSEKSVHQHVTQS